MLKAIGLDCDTTYEMDLDTNQNTKIISAYLWKNLKIIYRKNDKTCSERFYSVLATPAFLYGSET